MLIYHRVKAFINKAALSAALSWSAGFMVAQRPDTLELNSKPEFFT